MGGVFTRKIRRWSKKRLPRFKRYFLSTAIALLHGWIFAGPVGERAEPLLLDVWYSLRGTLPPPDDVVIVAIDQQSYEHLKLSQLEPWPRSLNTRLLNQLAEYNAKNVIFDLVFRAASKDHAEDQAFAEALGKLRAIIATYRQTASENEPGFESAALLPIIREKASGEMFINLHPDFGSIRRFPFGYGARPEIPPVAAAVGADFAEHPDPDDFIRYYGPPNTITTVPFYKVIEDHSGQYADLFRNKHVFIGAKLLTAAGNVRKDSFLTPVSQDFMFGVEIHATMAGNIIEQEWIRRAPRNYEAGILNSAALVLMLCTLSLRPIRGFILLLGVEVLWSTGAYLAFTSGYFVPGAILMLIIMPVSLLTTTFYYYLVLQKSYAEMENSLGIKLHVPD